MNFFRAAVTALDLSKFLKQITLQKLLLKCAPISELPSNISAMYGNGVFFQWNPDLKFCTDLYPSSAICLAILTSIYLKLYCMYKKSRPLCTDSMQKYNSSMV